MGCRAGVVAVPGKVASCVTSVSWSLLAVSGEVTLLLPAEVAVPSGVVVVASCVDEWLTTGGSKQYSTAGNVGNSATILVLSFCSILNRET
jgi:hypothetical protein